MAESFLDYGGGQSLENVLLKKLQAGGAQPAGGEVPTIPGVATQPTLDVGTANVGVPEPSFSDKLMKGLTDYGPLIAQMGTALMRPVGPGAKGQETVGSQMGSAITGALESQKMNEALRKMIAGQLSGKGGGSFNEGQPVGLTGAEVAGLTPDQISGLYGIGLKVRESELKRPMDAMTAVSDAYLKVMSGAAKPAEMEVHLATAQKARQEIAGYEVKTLIDQLTKIQALNKADAEIAEIKAKTTAIPAETAKKEAETEKTKKETKKLTQELDPEFVAMKKRLEARLGTPLHEVRRGDQVTLTNPITGDPVVSYTVGAPPETGAKTREAEMKLTKAAMIRIAPLSVKYLEAEMSALPGGKQKVDLQNLISSLRGYTGEIDPGVTLAKASPELQEKFNNLIDIYAKTPGLSETRFGTIVHSVFGSPGTAAPAAPAPTVKGEKPIIQRNVVNPPAAPPIADFTKQLQGQKPGVFESNSWRIRWDGTTVTSTEPIQPTKAAPAYNFGTFQEIQWLKNF